MKLNVTRRIALLPLFIITIVFISNCSKKDIVSPSTDQSIGEIRPTGNSEGAIVTKEIGTQGGSITSSDKTITINIPAGALTSNTVIGIEPISNSNVAGIGNAWRLTPHGQQFAKPVGITISYQANKDSITFQQALGLSYQDEKGIWNFTGNSSIDTSTKKVTYNTTHFSDWSLMPWLILNPYYKILSEGEEQDIEALRYIPFDGCGCPDDDMIPKVDKGIPVGKPQPLDKKFIGEWKLNGPGYLIAGNDNFASYKAPNAIPQTYTAAVTLRLKSSHTLILVCNITLMSKDVFEWRFNGGPWQQLDAKLTSLGNNRLAIAYVFDKTLLSMTWPAATRLPYYWGNEEFNANFTYFPNSTDKAYNAFYKVDDADHDSGGSIQLTELGAVGEYCAGNFTIKPAGFYTVATGKQISTATIEGRFKLKRY